MSVSNVSANFSSTGPPVLPYSHTANDVILSLMIFVSAVGILANGFVVLGFAMRIVKMTPFMLLLLNLSVADIIMQINVYPHLFIEPWDYTHVSRGVGSVICAVADKSAPTYMAAIVNALTLVYISFIRVASFSNTRGKPLWITRRWVVILFVALVWAVGIGAFLPHFFRFHIDSRGICVNENEAKYRVTTAVGATIMLVVPTSALTANFIRTATNMWSHSSLGGSSVISQQRQQITGMLLGLTLTFAVLNTPITIFFILRGVGYFDSEDEFETKMSMSRVYHPAFLVFMFNSLSDPILYAFCWKSFRSGFVESMKTVILPRHKTACATGSKTPVTSVLDLQIVN